MQPGSPNTADLGNEQLLEELPEHSLPAGQTSHSVRTEVDENENISVGQDCAAINFEGAKLPAVAEVHDESPSSEYSPAEQVPLDA